jgi:enamine deaminase RidA (YjgF/YER057c/UK114 family)
MSPRGFFPDYTIKVDELPIQSGSDREHLHSATVYVRDMKDFEVMNVVWDAWVPEGYAPARACVEERMARAELLDASSQWSRPSKDRSPANIEQ